MARRQQSHCTSTRTGELQWQPQKKDQMRRGDAGVGGDSGLPAEKSSIRHGTTGRAASAADVHLKTLDRAGSRAGGRVQATTAREWDRC